MLFEIDTNYYNPINIHNDEHHYGFFWGLYNYNYMVSIDWGNDGSFGVFDEVTTDVRSIHYSKGKSSELGKANVGEATITLNNDTGKYSPTNSSSSLYGNLVPRRAVKITAPDYKGDLDGDGVRTSNDMALMLSYILNYPTIPSTPLSEAEFLSRVDMNDNGIVDVADYALLDYLIQYQHPNVLYGLFYGYIEEIIPHPHLTQQDCIITAVDGLDYLARQELDTTLYKNQLTGTLVGYIADDAGWSSSLRAIDTGQDTVPYAYWHGDTARGALGEIEDSELGFVLIDGEGNLRYEDRHHRYGLIHQISWKTFTNTMADITYSMNPSRIYNIVRCTVTPWQIQALAELWKLQEIPSIPAGESSTWWGESENFVDAWTDINDGAVDFTANSQSDGGGTNLTAQVTVATIKYAKSIKITLTNTAGIPAYITLLRARGTKYTALTSVVRKAENTTSQTTYQKRTLSIDGKFITSTDKGQDFCNYGIVRYKDPQAEVSMTIQNKNTQMKIQLIRRQISDRITVVNTKLGLNADYFIDGMEHDITMSGLKHIATYTLKDASQEDFWCLGYSTLGTKTKLGY